MMEKSIVINSSSGSNPITVDSSNDISSMEGKGPRVAMCVVPKAAVGSAWENESLSPIQNLEETSSVASSSVLLLQQVKIQLYDELQNKRPERPGMTRQSKP